MSLWALPSCDWIGSCTCATASQQNGALRTASIQRNGPDCSVSLFFGPRIITPDDETPRRIVEFATLTAALPITALVQQRRFRGVARDPEHPSTVGTGDCFYGHFVIPVWLRRRKTVHAESGHNEAWHAHANGHYYNYVLVVTWR